MIDLEHRFADMARQIEDNSVDPFGEIRNTR